MRRLSIIIISLSISLGVYWYASSADTMNVKSSHKEWAKIITVEERVFSTTTRYGDSSHQYALVTVRLNDGSSVKMHVRSRPSPNVGSCVPLFVKRFFSGEVVASLNVMEWQVVGTKKEHCIK